MKQRPLNLLVLFTVVAHGAGTWEQQQVQVEKVTADYQAKYPPGEFAILTRCHE